MEVAGEEEDSCSVKITCSGARSRSVITGSESDMKTASTFGSVTAGLASESVV